jgi:hypothetical protein
MKTHVAIATFVALTVAAVAASKTPSSAEERKRLSGTWRGKMAHNPKRRWNW